MTRHRHVGGRGTCWPGSPAPKGLLLTLGYAPQPRSINSDDRLHFATSFPERLWLPSTPCHCDKPSAPSQSLMDGPHTGFHTSPSSPEAVTQVIGVISVDYMPNADKTVHNRELCALPLIVWARELLGTDSSWAPQLSGVTQGEAAGPAGPVGNKCKSILAPTWRMC